MEVLLIAAVAGTGALGTWMADRYRSRRRNSSGRCATCGAAWEGAALEGAYLIHGRLVCEACAQSARKRMPWQLGAIAAFTLVAVGSTTAAQGPMAVALSSALGVAGMLVGSVQLMKLANRRAQRRIAEGEYPGLERLGSGEEVAAERLDRPRGE